MTSRPTSLAEFRGRAFEKYVLRPLIARLQFGRFILPIPEYWPPSPWQWPSCELARENTVVDLQNTIETLNPGGET